MARTFLLIDGYNLLYAAGLGQPNYAEGELHRCRQALLNLLAGTLTDAQRPDTKIIFDAANAPPDRSRSQKHARMQVEFAAAGQDADSTIEDLIKQHSSPRQILVISSDHRLHKAARKRRAKVMDSEKFLRQLESAASRADKRQQRAENHAQLNRIDWISEFGDIPGANELQRERDRHRNRFRPPASDQFDGLED